ncbi:MAG: hypothetical protein D6706_01865 [Chloroflexi bacterium]|nr:MAG: hypothetical protein D6706_01865 [Chloroflexota bacterium]
MKMLDFLRQLRKSAEERRQEQLHAYLDDALSPRERQQFEQLLAQDAELQALVAQHRRLKQQLRELPRRPVPRNFTLDPAVYGRPARQPLVQLYPVLRMGTVLTAFFFVIALFAGLGGGLGIASRQLEMAEPVALSVESAVTEIPPEAVSAEAEMPAADVAAETTEEGEELPATELAETAVFSETVIEGEEVVEEAPAEEETGAFEPLPPLAATQPAAVPSVLPTATRSDLPRPTPLATPPNRALEETAESVAVVTDTEKIAPEETAVLPTPPTPPSASFQFGLRQIQLGLGVLLIIFACLTWLARRQAK